MINSQPIGEHTFARCFFEVWDALESSALSEGRDVAAKPVYFRFLTLMSFHVFLQESVDVAVYEVGVGGAWDSTNLVEHPVVTGITMLGIDHVAVLGDTIEKIAWHKAGIFKTGVPAFTVPQVPGAAGVLAECARERDVQLETIKIDPLVHRFNLFPNEEYQRENVSLALALVRAAGKRLQLEDMDTDENATLMRDGIEHTEWRGRCETKIDGLRKWYLDGAHTVESLRVAGRWYSQQCSKNPGTCVLIFNQQSRPEAPDLLRGLQDFLSKECPVKFDHVIFSTNVTRKKTGYRIGVFHPFF
jgi:folylpolyglutamate synthase